jgi:hypothetical protein
VLNSQLLCVTEPGYYISEGDAISATSASTAALCVEQGVCAGGQPVGTVGGVTCPEGQSFRRLTSWSYYSSYTIVFDASTQTVTSYYDGWLHSGSAPFSAFAGGATSVLLSGGSTHSGCSPRTTRLYMSYRQTGYNSVLGASDPSGSCNYWVQLAIATPLFDRCYWDPVGR